MSLDSPYGKHVNQFLVINLCAYMHTFCYIHTYTLSVLFLWKILTDTQGKKREGNKSLWAVFSCCKPAWTMGDQPIVKLKDISHAHHEQFWVAHCAGCTPTGLPFPELEKFQGRKQKTSICPQLAGCQQKEAQINETEYEISKRKSIKPKLILWRDQ